MNRKRTVAIIMAPANLLAGNEVIEKTRYLLQEEHPDHPILAEPLDDPSIPVPDGFTGFQFVIEVHVKDTGFLTITDKG